jgi:hypothetical protein
MEEWAAKRRGFVALYAETELTREQHEEMYKVKKERNTTDQI